MTAMAGFCINVGKLCVIDWTADVMTPDRELLCWMAPTMSGVLAWSRAVVKVSDTSGTGSMGNTGIRQVVPRPKSKTLRGPSVCLWRGSKEL